MATNIDHFIDGEIFKGQGRRTADVFNPATGEVTKSRSKRRRCTAGLVGNAAGEARAGDVQVSRSFDQESRRDCQSDLS
jgi:acyl-CoA reductase-like NAD-dependent aldehyde dehydrogenase